MKTAIALLEKNGKDLRREVAAALNVLGLNQGKFVVAIPSAIAEIENTHELLHERFASPVMIAVIFSETQSKPQITRIQKGVALFEGRLYSPPHNPSFSTILESNPSTPIENQLENFVRKTEGDFTLVIAESNRILAVRDPVGVQPLYYGENNDFVAFASSKTALWKLGICKACSFPPGNVGRANLEGLHFKPVRTLVSSEPEHITINTAARMLQKLLEHSIRVRVSGLKDIAVAFSGGLDSSVVAFLAKKCGVNVHLVHVSLPNQSETEVAKRTADELNLPLEVNMFDAKDVEETVPLVIRIVEDPDPVKVAIGVPFYWIAMKTVESGFSVLFAGQGADELFGGYNRYVTEYLFLGEEKLLETMYTDVIKLHETNIERDVKICGFHGIELRLPFSSYDLAEFALRLPLNMKIEKRADGLRKLVLRRLASNIGLPEAVVNRPKKAVQYATGVNEVLARISKKRGLTIREYVESFLEGPDTSCR